DGQHLLAAGLFGRHVGGGAHYGPRLRLPGGVDALGEPEVGDERQSLTQRRQGAKTGRCRRGLGKLSFFWPGFVLLVWLCVLASWREALLLEQDVGWLEVAVQDAALVGEVNGPRHGCQELSCRPRGRGELRHHLFEVAALNELHDEVVLSLVLAHLVDG